MNRAFGVFTRPGSRESRENAKTFASTKLPFTMESHTDCCIAMGGENVAGFGVVVGRTTVAGWNAYVS